MGELDGKTLIDGVRLQPLRQIKDELGSVMHWMRSDSPLFERFGEVYFSVINPNITKAWKQHSEMIQNIVVPVGEVLFVLHDERRNSPTFGMFNRFRLGPNHYSLLQIPPKVWYGFKEVGGQVSIIGNCTSIPHDPSEAVQTNISTFKHAWSV